MMTVNFSTFDNDDMKSSKRHVVFLSLIFLIKKLSYLLNCFLSSTSILADDKQSDSESFCNTVSLSKSELRRL